MEPSDNISRAIGKLFYAIAAVDGLIHPREYESILSSMRIEGEAANKYEKDITPLDISEIIKGFYDMLLVQKPPYDAFKEFASYKIAHEHEFTAAIKKWIWQMADRITYSFAGKNKSEVIILSKLKCTLRK